MGKIINTISKPLLFLIRAYRYLISPLLGNCCRFHPSCSVYAIDALKSHSIFYGSYLTLKRVLRCHPFSAGGYDPVPEAKHHANKCN